MNAATRLSGLLLGGMLTTALASPIDLSHWKLTIPEADAATGKAKDLKPNELSGYTSEWFHPTPDGGLLFAAPVGGATTAHSHYTRSELRERLNPANDRENWTIDGTSVLTARLKITRAPDVTSRLIIGQIHGDKYSPMVKLTWYHEAGSNSGQLYGVTVRDPKPDGDSASEDSGKCMLLPKLALGETFSYTITVDHGTLSYSVAGGETCTQDVRSWKGIGLYFKAGMYVGAKDGGGTGEAVFYELNTRHG